MKIIAKNKKAYFDYEILEKFEAGVVLTGQEVKSVKTRGLSLKGSYVTIDERREVFWVGANISPYQPQNCPQDYHPQQPRKLLLKKSEVRHLIGKIKESGLTLIPLKVYTKKGKIKLEVGLAKGRKKFNKKELIKKRDAQREIRRALKGGV